MKAENKGLKFNNYFETISLIMIVWFAVLPLAAVLSPEKYGTIFTLFGIIEISVFVVFVIAYFLFWSLNSHEKTFLGKIKVPFRNIKHSFIENKHYIFLLAAYILCIISACFASDLKRAFRGTDFRVDGVFMYTVFAVLFVFGTFINNPSKRKIIYAVYITAFLVNSVIMIFQHYGVLGAQNAERCPESLLFIKNYFESRGIRVGHFYKGLTGAFYNSNHIGYYLAMCAMIISGLFIVSQKRIYKIVFALLCIFSLRMVILNDTFGCYIAILLTLLIIPVVVFAKSKNLRKVLVSSVPLIMLIILSFIPTIYGKSIVADNILHLKSDTEKIVRGDETAAKAGSGRWELWGVTCEIIAEKPILGFGPDNVNAEFKARNQDMTRAHNEILELTVTNGSLFSIAYFGAIFYIIFKGFKRYVSLKNDDGEAVLIPLMVCVAYMISAMVGVYLFYTACHFIIMLSLLKVR